MLKLVDKFNRTRKSSRCILWQNELFGSSVNVQLTYFTLNYLSWARTWLKNFAPGILPAIVCLFFKHWNPSTEAFFSGFPVNLSAVSSVFSCYSMTAKNKYNKKHPEIIVCLSSTSKGEAHGSIFTVCTNLWFGAFQRYTCIGLGSNGIGLVLFSDVGSKIPQCLQGKLRK